MTYRGFLSQQSPYLGKSLPSFGFNEFCLLSFLRKKKLEHILIMKVFIPGIFSAKFSVFFSFPKHTFAIFELKWVMETVETERLRCQLLCVVNILI